MLKIKGFNQYSVIIGSMHMRAFSADNVTGIITDYVLGEQGAENSPLPKDFYEKVSLGQGTTQISSKNNTRQFLATRDRLSLSERTLRMEDSFVEEEGIYARAKHLMIGAQAFLRNPKSIFLGMVWQFTEASAQQRERFKHPVAEDLLKKLSKIELDAKCHPSEVGTRLTFRKKVPEGWLLKETNDYINILLAINDVKPIDLWPDEDNVKDEPLSDLPLVTTITVDIQRILDPRVLLTEKLFESHYKFCQQFMNGEMQDLLGRVGFVKE
jgi:hypothetical protein